MATVIKKQWLDVPAETVWTLVADVGNVPALTGMVASSRMDGDKRMCTLAEGGELHETILSVDHEHMRMAYRIHASPFPITEHAASIVVEAVEGGSVVTWTTDLLPNEAKPIFEQAADAMFGDLVQRMQARA